MRPALPTALALLLLSSAAGAAPPSVALDLASPARAVLDAVPAERPILFGEIHGTDEAPEFVAQLVREASTAAPVLLGLEVASAEQDRIDAFLASNGDDKARNALLEGGFWHNADHDGRDSLAMLRLLDAARVLHADGRRIDILAFDCPRNDGETRDSAMARCIDAGIEKHRGVRTFILTGNYHARVSVGAPWDATLEFSGYRLRHRNPAAIDLTANGGTAWVCTPECGATSLSDRPGAAAGDVAVRIDAEPDERGYSGEVRFPRFHASPPAIEAAAASATPSPASRNDPPAGTQTAASGTRSNS